ncbi:MAG: hypothetical protein K2X93_07080 [Candidatus Obscuribacterales bacterium]|nr:hypothetical protein [Candidatus Obscuribacterales bacterium]
MKLEQVDRKKLLPLLDELTGAIEDLLFSGLTTASEQTVKTLGVTFQESSRMGLLRLGTTLRAVNEEVARFTKNESDFSKRRLSFFLNRSWLLSHAIKRAIEEDQSEQFERLMLTPSPKPIDRIEAVTVGVVKRAASTFCAFDFRLQCLKDSGHLKKGEKLLWSCVFPKAPNTEIPPEGYLHLPQKQKFKASILLEPHTVIIENCNASPDVTGSQRIVLTESSTVALGAEFTDWPSLFKWDQARAVERIRNHTPGPFDLEVELQEEVFVEKWAIGETSELDDGKGIAFPILTDKFQCEATVSNAKEHNNLRSELEKVRSGKKPSGPLFGVMHYERCKLVFQPLTVFEEPKPKHLMISPDKIDPKALLQAIKF